MANKELNPTNGAAAGGSICRVSSDVSPFAAIVLAAHPTVPEGFSAASSN